MFAELRKIFRELLTSRYFTNTCRKLRENSRSFLISSGNFVGNSKKKKSQEVEETFQLVQGASQRVS